MMPLSTFTQQTYQRGADLGLHSISEIDQLCETKHLLHGAKIASRDSMYLSKLSPYA